MQYEAPSLSQWKQLYEAIAEFETIKCWEWMYDDDVFGVKDPQTGETAYCCILGNAGEEFGIVAYIGQEGLKNLLDILYGNINPDDKNIFFEQKSLACYLTDRERLEPRELKTIRETGVKFRGKNHWPLVRSYEPGMAPWYLDAQQCCFFTHIIYQAIDVSMRCKEDKAILESDSPLTFLVRVPKTDANQNLIWEDRRITVKKPASISVSFQLDDEEALHRLKMIKKRPDLVLEADVFFLPKAIGEKDERPYFPMMAVLMDHKRGMVLSYNMFTNLRHDGYKGLEILIDFIFDHNALPSKILTQNFNSYCLFKDICQQLGIELKESNRLKNVENFKREMANYV